MSESELLSQISYKRKAGIDTIMIERQRRVSRSESLSRWKLARGEDNDGPEGFLLWAYIRCASTRRMTRQEKPFTNLTEAARAALNPTLRAPDWSDAIASSQLFTFRYAVSCRIGPRNLFTFWSHWREVSRYDAQCQS